MTTILGFVVVFLAVMFGLPHVLHSILWFHQQRMKQERERHLLLSDEVQLLERKHNMMRELRRASH